MNDLKEINRMTLWEYDIRIRAYNLKQVDHERDLHLAAWLNREAQAKKKKGKNGLKYIYTSFKDFFDTDSRLAEVSGKVENKPMTAAQRAAEYARRKKNGEL